MVSNTRCYDTRSGAETDHVKVVILQFCIKLSNYGNGKASERIKVVPIDVT